jgi:tRNA(Ile)-lysidine synthase
VSTNGHDANRRPRLTPAVADCRRAVTECVSEHVEPAIPRHFLIATSGGADSLALCLAAEFSLPRLGHSAEAVIIDHQLQENSAEVAHQSQARVEAMGLPARVIQVSVDQGGSVEEGARNARYSALEAHLLSTGAHGVLLGHTLDDQAETVLLGLTRGSGPASIRGMARVRGIYYRPFLGLTRATTHQACIDLGVEWWDDPHNQDRRFVRPRIRHDILPAIEDALGPGIPEALANTARLIAADDDYLALEAAAASERCLTGAGDLTVDELSGLAEPIRRRVLRQWV